MRTDVCICLFSCVNEILNVDAYGCNNTTNEIYVKTSNWGEIRVKYSNIIIHYTVKLDCRYYSPKDKVES